MKLFEGRTFEATSSTSRSEFLDAIRKFGFFSSVEFAFKDPEKDIVFIREVGVLERLGNMVRDIFAKDSYNPSREALLHLSQKNMALAGVLGRSVFDVCKKPLSARDLGDKLKLEEKKLILTEESVLAAPSERKMIVTDAVSGNFSDAHKVELSTALDQNDFHEYCGSVLSKAREESSEKLLIVTFQSVSGNGEPSDEAINKLLLAIEKHHQSHPTSRLMIATNGNRDLYERLLNLKVQHDAKKVLQSSKSDLGLTDLLMIPARGDEVVKLKPISEEELKKHPTRVPGVFVYITDYPEMIRSDLSIIKKGTLSASYGQPEEKPAEASKLIWSIGETEGLFLKLADEFKGDKKTGGKKNILDAARFPAMDLPVERLIVFQSLRVDYDSNRSGYDDAVDEIKNFYLKELREERGRVVIETPEKKYACEGLLLAIEELRQKKEGPDKIMITGKSNHTLGYENLVDKSAPGS